MYQLRSKIKSVQKKKENPSRIKGKRKLLFLPPIYIQMIDSYMY